MSTTPAPPPAALKGTPLRYQVCLYLSQKACTRTKRLPAGTFGEAVKEFPMLKENSIRGMWQRYKKAILNPQAHQLNVGRKKGQGRKMKVSVEEVHQLVRAVRFSLRRNIRTLAKQIGIPRATLHRLLKMGVLQKSRNAIKPMLTEKNKAQRVDYCNSFVEGDGKFGSLLNEVHVDEKWWFMSRERPRATSPFPEKRPRSASASTRSTLKN